MWAIDKADVTKNDERKNKFKSNLLYNDISGVKEHVLKAPNYKKLFKQRIINSLFFAASLGLLFMYIFLTNYYTNELDRLAELEDEDSKYRHSWILFFKSINKTCYTLPVIILGRRYYVHMTRVTESKNFEF